MNAAAILEGLGETNSRHLLLMSIKVAESSLDLGKAGIKYSCKHIIMAHI